jgi:3-oxoacyl-[acyl-carrier protein] reductase
MRCIDLSGQTAIITGSSTGIGRATAICFAEAGANVAIHYSVKKEEAEATAASVRRLGREALLVAGDFSAPGEPARVISEAAIGFDGKVDILVNNAGSLLRRVAISNMTAAMWSEVIELNLSSAFHATQAALQYMKPGGRIVNVASIAAYDGGGPHSFAYAAAKGGLVSLTRGLAKELANAGIRVNCISPGTITTPFQERFGTPERLESIRRQLPLQRLGTAEDCADAILFLVSPLSAFMTGEDLQVNGGQYFV